MKSSLGKKLFISGMVVLFFIILIAVAGDVCIRILKRTSTLMVIEFIEMEELQNVLLSVSHVTSPVKTYLITGDQTQKTVFVNRLTVARDRIEICKNALTVRHSQEHLDTLLHSLQSVESVGKRLFDLPSGVNPKNNENLLNQMEEIINRHVKQIKVLLAETKAEVSKYVKINETATQHSTITIASLGLFLICIVIFGGLFFINQITAPSIQLLQTIHDVTKGDIKAKVEIHSRDEFGKIAIAFNSMLERIDEVTVSRDHYNNILNSMFNSVIVFDREGYIKSVNSAACLLLDDTENNLIASRISDFLAGLEELSTNTRRNSTGMSPVQQDSILKTRHGTSIPVLYTLSEIKNVRRELSGYVIVIHDLSEQREFEKQIEQIKRERSIAIQEVQERERHRIAKDLHDGIVQILTSVSYTIQNLEPVIPNSTTEICSTLSQVMDQLHVAIHECRRVSHDLVPLALHDLGLVPAISQLIGRLNQQQTIAFKFDSFNMEQRTDSRIELGLYRICQESINNILKHSHVTAAYIQLIKHDDTIVLVVEDNGIGFQVKEPNQKSEGIGLENMRERTETFGGTMIIQSSENQGTELIIEIPCPMKHA